MNCVFADKIAIERPLTGSAAAGDVFLPVDNASSWFSVGDQAFVSDADGSDLEMTGPVTEVKTDGIVCLCHLKKSRSSGDICWKPEHWFAWSVKRGMPKKVAYDPGVNKLRSVGGRIYLTGVRTPVWKETLRFHRMRNGEAESFISWLENYCSAGSESFYFSDENRDVRIVVLSDEQIDLEEESPERVTLKMTLEEKDRT